ncbi:hypothetical protein [Glaciimonas immobilis]|uniref:Histidine phosphatase family protein n=1 Tax=Glaciimonas immobilis TaxID=728004 RepID=A0A840RZ60_9BURK|nr:hypothetical protein [Glaciimonas immobilis]KAF3996315.1 hypothetical protein HAV38_19035 [Glaciimonas immobilis]MBB5202146.1 hypothetical protein [Glaciimonas immobilis]
MKKTIAILLFYISSSTVFGGETIVFIRHGEKPKQGLGQLNCQGLNRSMALPDVLIKKFGKPDAIFAPDPSQLKKDGDRVYAYVRPLATIEPTAIRLEMPVNVAFGFDNSAGLKDALLAPVYKNAVVFVAWEHHLAEKVARQLVASISKTEAAKVPEWQNDDFDSIYVVRTGISAGVEGVSFNIDKQGLNALSSTCPVD